MLTQYHVDLINNTFTDVHLQPSKQSILAYDLLNSISYDKNNLRGREFHCSLVLNSIPISFYLPLDFDKEVLESTVREVLKCKVTSLQNSLNKVNSLLGDMV